MLLFAGCGGGGGKSSSIPTTPSPPPQTNRVPVVNSVTVNPGTGIQDRTLFQFSANASDPDGDPLTYAWNIAGNSASGASASMSFLNGFAATATVTVDDGKGGTATASQPFQCNTMSGTWSGAGAFGSFTMTLTQTAGFITGTYSDEYGSAQVGPTGELGTIDNNGSISLRVKQAPYADFTMKGILEGSGRRVTGNMTGSGADGRAFVMQK